MPGKWPAKLPLMDSQTAGRLGGWLLPRRLDQPSVWAHVPAVGIQYLLKRVSRLGEQHKPGFPQQASSRGELLCLLCLCLPSPPVPSVLTPHSCTQN